MRFNSENIFGAKVGVIGAGKSGRAVSNLLLKKGADVFLSDGRYSDDLKKACSELDTAGFSFELGIQTDRVIKNKDLLVISPGVAIDNPYVLKAVEKGIPVTGELEAAFWFCKNKIIAVTGTNGKSTVTMMLENIYRTAGRTALGAGNLGIAFSEIVDTVDPEVYLILEVSSYQLETINKFKPNTAVILNITPDHLHRHKTFEEYVRRKLDISRNMNGESLIVLNQNDPVLVSSDIPGNAVKQWFSNDSTVENGAGVMEDKLFAFKNRDAVEIIPVNEIPVPGFHNIDNALACTCAAINDGIEPEYIAIGIRSYSNLEHRLELVKETGGVKYYNDSKATNIDAMIQALKTFTEPVILIAGGEDKGSDLSIANDMIKEKVKTLILLGEAAGRMNDVWSEVFENIVHIDSFEDGVLTASKDALPGEVVLLSPGCASFDMFNSFEERGEAFKNIVNSI
ncbi:UDP-N-acetylmuramoyl-L-alanine--D-glutamate ligase [candidate division KSB1 bacterium]